MKRLIWVLIAITLLGCTTSKKINETSNKHSQQIDVTTNTNVNTQVVENLDTNIVISGNEVTASRQLDELIAGKLITAKENGTEVEVRYDQITGEVKAKARTINRTVPVQFERTTTSSESIKQAVKANEEEKQKTQVIEKQAISTPLIVIVCIIVFCVIIFFWVNKR